MTPERWRRIEDLCHAALSRRAEERTAFLTQACAGDEALLREVESLVAQDRNAAGFLSVPAVAVVGSTGGEPTTRALDGQWFGVYAIRSRIGVGGMGEVYRARDTKLNRDVALKVLPTAFALDPDRLARFRREAQMLAALNHPNIGAIYGLEESKPSTSSGQAAVQALVLELVEGPTLADRIAEGPIPLPAALLIARQIIDALETAHEQGIVHRDLKPANVKVRADGVVKVLDFGLAKVLARDQGHETHSPTLSDGATRQGIILGTAAYMSPEQAKGQAVDRRADIWSFGGVLFEMLVGRPAFQGETVTDLLAAVVKDDPDWAALPDGMPRNLQTLLHRCLKKDPRQRLQAIGDARIEIDALDDVQPASDLGEGAAAANESRVQPASAKVKAVLPWLAFAALAAGVVVWEAGRRATPQENPAGMQFARFTDWEGTEAGAEISPDGRFVAFIADKAGQFDIWLSQVGTGHFENLTGDLDPLQAAFGTFRRAGFSGDGSEIWFSFETGPSMAQLIMPMMGGSRRPFLDKFATAPSWSPDGTRLTYFKNEDGDPLFVADRTGADARQILVLPGEHVHNPVWSSDGQWIYFARGPEPSDAMDVWRIRPSGESLERLTEGGIAVNFMAPLNPRTVLYTARAPDRSGPWLWTLDVERKITRRVSTGLGHYTHVSASRDGRRVVSTVSNPTATLWRVPLRSDGDAGEGDVHPYSLPTARALAPRFAGRSLFYLSAGGTGDALWRLQDEQASELAKGGEGGLFEPPAVSRDGSRVAIIVTRDGKRQLVIVSADGRSSRTLAASLDVQGAAGQGLADWSPDGTSIVVGARDAQGPGLFRVPVDGGAPVRLVDGKAQSPVWSPDGNVIVYAGKFFTGQVQLLGVRPDGSPVDLPPLRTRPGGYRFLPNGKGLVYQPFIPSLDFWLFDFSTNTPRQLTHLSNQGAIRTFDITPDGKEIVFDRTRENSDVVLIEVPDR
jgi:Tol biopolymer transport system component